MKFFLQVFCASLFIEFIQCDFRDKVIKALGESDFELDETRLTFLGLSEVEQKWGHFLSSYNKDYGDQSTKQERRYIFDDNNVEIRETQQRFAEGTSTFVFSNNKFSDLSNEEFQSLLLRGAQVPKRNYAVNQTEIVDSSNYNSTQLDLSLKEIPVKDQEKCGSCWAFSGVGVLEYNLYNRYGTYISLSEQKAMDCSRRNGCNGGWPRDVYEYFIHLGLPLGSEFPYTASNVKCRTYRKSFFKRTSSVTYSSKNGPDSWYAVTPNDEESLKIALQKFGWVSVCVNANKWQFYLGGVMRDDGTDSGGINHAVILVGYGVDKTNNLPFWKIRNSWGADWGEGKFFFRILSQIY